MLIPLLAGWQGKLGPRPKVFDRYPYGDAKVRHFYERCLKGEPVKAGWVPDPDFEKGTC